MMDVVLLSYFTVFPGELISLCYLFHSTTTQIELHQDGVLNKIAIFASNVKTITRYSTRFHATCIVVHGRVKGAITCYNTVQ